MLMLKRHLALMTIARMAETGEGAAPAPEAETPKVADKPKLLSQNGVTQPSEGTKTRRVWDIATEISTSVNRPALRDEVMAQGEKEGLSKGTIATQYGKWCQFYGVSVEQRKAARAINKENEAPESPADAAEAEGE